MIEDISSAKASPNPAGTEVREQEYANPLIGPNLEMTLINTENVLTLLECVNYDTVGEEEGWGFGCVLSGIRQALRFEREHAEKPGKTS